MNALKPKESHIALLLQRPRQEQKTFLGMENEYRNRQEFFCLYQQILKDPFLKGLFPRVISF